MVSNAVTEAMPALITVSVIVKFIWFAPSHNCFLNFKCLWLLADLGDGLSFYTTHLILFISI